MIFNLVQYLRNEFPNETIYPMEQYIIINSVPDRIIIIRETGGIPRFIIDENTFQLKFRDIDPYNARELAYDFYNFLHGEDGRKGRWGVELPEVIIGSTTYLAQKIKQINAIQKPEGLGVDENNRSEYIFNIQVYL